MNFFNNNKVKKLEEENKELTNVNEILNKRIKTLTDEVKSLQEELNKRKTNMYDLKSLINITFNRPSFQREPNKQRIKELSIIISNKPNFIVPIIIGVLDQQYYIIDGQHRISAIHKIFSEELYEKIKEVPVVFNHYRTMEEMRLDFEIINDTMTLSQLIYCDEKTKSIINETVTQLQEIYTYYFKSGRKRMARPFIDTTDFENIIIQSKIIEKRGIDSASKLIRLIKALNEHYKSEYNNSDKNKKITKILDKIKKQKYEFYLGMKKDWIDDLMTIQEEKKNITKRDREVIWRLHFGLDSEAKCKCCNINIISKDNPSYHCGHIIPDSKGGRVNRENILPICQSCNLSMSDTPMFEYMKKHNYNINYALLLETLYKSNPDYFEYKK